ncbi:MAG: GDSL-type esterase/lipase family protein [Oscillospiraceae bacterium]|nr:GDSL-type esterase/lipase family protein [Oscillospiraceae bacterium]
MKRHILSAALIVIAALNLLPTPAIASESVTAVPAYASVAVNGRIVDFDAYNIKGSNYFKLRDLACVLNGTAKQFRVVWDAASKTVVLTSSTPYTPDGDEMQGRATESKIAAASGAKVILDGKSAALSSYNIDGSNYFKLRDVGRALNFNISWNDVKKTIMIDTTSGYTRPAPTLLDQTEDMGQEYLDSIVFLGDSTTYGMLAYGVLSGGTASKQVWTPENRTFSLFNQSGILIKYPETGGNIKVETAVSLKKPEYMIITLGINGVASMGEDFFKSEYMALVTRITDACPDTKIILNSIYPVARNYGLLSIINNEKINTANVWVYELADEMELRWLDTASALKDEEGWLPAEYQNGDGMHLSLEALTLVTEYIRTHGYL